MTKRPKLSLSPPSDSVKKRPNSFDVPSSPAPKKPARDIQNGQPAKRATPPPSPAKGGGVVKFSAASARSDGDAQPGPARVGSDDTRPRTTHARSAGQARITPTRARISVEAHQQSPAWLNARRITKTLLVVGVAALALFLLKRRFV